MKTVPCEARQHVCGVWVGPRVQQQSGIPGSKGRAGPQRASELRWRSTWAGQARGHAGQAEGVRLAALWRGCSTGAIPGICTFRLDVAMRECAAGEPGQG